MAAPNPHMSRRGSPDPNSRYASGIPLTSAYCTGVALIDTTGGCGVTCTNGPVAEEEVVHPAVKRSPMVIAIARIAVTVLFMENLVEG